MLRKTAAAALALAVWALPAQAAEHEVLILAGGFYPEITYVQPGDSVTFVNTDQRPRRVFGDRYDFVSPKIKQNESWTLGIVANMRNDYFAKSFNVNATDTPVGEGSVTAQQEADVNDAGNVMRGVLSYAPPPAESE